MISPDLNWLEQCTVWVHFSGDSSKTGPIVCFDKRSSISGKNCLGTKKNESYSFSLETTLTVYFMDHEL